MDLYLVEWGYDYEPHSTDSVWTTEAAAEARASALYDPEDYRCNVWVKKYTADTPNGFQDTFCAETSAPIHIPPRKSDISWK
jgi:hypothetical protein